MLAITSSLGFCFGSLKSLSKSTHVIFVVCQPAARSLAKDLFPLLNRLQCFGELIPILHDNLDAQFLQRLRHFLLLLAATIAAYVSDGRNASTNRTQCPTLAVFDCNTFSRLFPNDLACVQVDCWIWLGGWHRKRGSGAEDMVRWEVFGLVDFVDGCLDSPKSTRADDRHAIFLRLVQLLQLFAASDARLRIALQLRNHLILFHADVFLHFIFWYFEVEFLLQGDDHATEVLADKVREELGAGVALINLVFGEDFVGEVGAGFEGELLR